MNSDDLSKLANIHRTTINRKVDKSMSEGVSAIKLGNRHFSFQIISGHYHYEEIFPKVVESEEDESHLEWMRASKEKQSEAAAKYRVVRDYNNRPDGESWKQFLARIEYKYRAIKPSKSKLFRWLEIVRGCEDEKQSVVLANLLDSRGKQTSNRSYSDEHWNMMESLILGNPDMRIKKVWEYIGMKFGEGNAPSYATISRMMARYKRENVMIWEYAKDPSKAKGKLRPAPGRMDEDITRNNQLWELDGTPADVICSDGVRYTLSAVMDVYSRRVAVVVAPTSSYSTIGKALRKAIKLFGIPEAMKIDNGKEYRSNSFEYTASRLRCEVIVCPPYSGEKKPHVERFFGTLTRDLFEECEGYIGHNVADREKIVNRQTHPKKLEAKAEWARRAREGDEFAKKFAIKKENLGVEVNIPMSRDELEVFISKWVEVYEHTLHRGIKSKPIERWNSCSIPVQRVSDERVLDVLVGMSEKKRVTKKGVTFLGVQYWHDILYDQVATSVWALSDDELGYLYLYTLDMKFLCRAENAEMLGKKRSDYIASRKHAKKEAKLIAKLQEMRRDLPTQIQELIEHRHQRVVQGAESEPELSLEYKSPVMSEMHGAVRDESELSADEQKAIEDEAVEVLVINGRPAFNSFFDRFLWDLENDRVEEDTKKLAQRQEAMWNMAVEEWESRKVG